MVAFITLTALSLATSVYGHGYLVVPESRTGLGHEANLDSYTECTILEPVSAWPDLTTASGKSPVATYAPGDIVNVQWCVDANGDHGGMFSYRICQDQTIVDKFLDASYLPTHEEKQAAEVCFQAGTLDCTDVSGQDCGAGDQTNCKGVDNVALNSCYTSIAGGYTVPKKIKIPDYSSEHTLLSLRWNSFQTGQVYLTCSNIAISGSSPGNGTSNSTTGA
ncbi:hypothetical protein GMDG_01921 [Pseudogymnoascus destructans 20631-21]|uniref:Uncharacterized protein n=1 Tax=Pseudogymnoascus destructans (strain ATCC MYA-4855 / 20631-21) TaxID=658429 RepID=L8FZK9_PSED2|nr:hypothetical protein GMDG_01921 [Pseudogymnoascus destructans 20631-21]